MSETLKDMAQWSLAMILVLAATVYTMIALFQGKATTGPPDWMTVAVGTAIGYYFGHRTTASAISQVTNGVTSMVANLERTRRSPSRATDPQPMPPVPPAEVQD